MKIILQRDDAHTSVVELPPSLEKEGTMGERKTDRQALKIKLDTLTDSEIAEVSDYISIMESLREQASKPDLFDDELVSVLADSIENRRARVVTEWDRVRRQAEHRAAMYAASGKPS